MGSTTAKKEFFYLVSQTHKTDATLGKDIKRNKSNTIWAFACVEIKMGNSDQ